MSNPKCPVCGVAHIKRPEKCIQESQLEHLKHSGLHVPWSECEECKPMVEYIMRLKNQTG